MTSRPNAMRWQCSRDGCFNEKRRPKIEVFHDCFTGGVNFGDVDGEVELGGKFLQLEWKGEGGSIKTGQRRKFEAYTRNDGWAVIVIEGDAATMWVTRYCLFWKGSQTPWRDAALDDVKVVIRRWVDSTKPKVQAA